MKKVLSIASLGILVISSCSKSSNNGGNNTPPVDSVALLKTELSGKWNATKHSVTNFSVAGIADQTWTPTHPESLQFSSDSAAIDTWETMTLDFTKTPTTFSVTQNTEFKGTYSYVVGKGLFVYLSSNLRDTINVVSISSTQMETYTKVAIAGSYEYTLHDYWQR